MNSRLASLNANDRNYDKYERPMNVQSDASQSSDLNEEVPEMPKFAQKSEPGFSSDPDSGKNMNFKASNDSEPSNINVE